MGGGGGGGGRRERLHWQVQGSTSSPTGGVPAVRPGEYQQSDRGEYQQSDRSVSVGGCYGVMEFVMSRRIKPKKNMCAFQIEKNGAT